MQRDDPSGTRPGGPAPVASGADGDAVLAALAHRLRARSERQQLLTERLRSGELRPGALADLAEMAAAARRGVRDGEHILVLSGAGPSTRGGAAVPLGQALSSAVAASEAASRTVVPPTPSVSLDPGAETVFGQILAELLAHATGVTPAGERLELHVRFAPDGGVVLELLCAQPAQNRPPVEDLDRMLSAGRPDGPVAPQEIGLFVAARLAHTIGARLGIRSAAGTPGLPGLSPIAVLQLPPSALVGGPRGQDLSRSDDAPGVSVPGIAAAGIAALPVSGNGLDGPAVPDGSDEPATTSVPAAPEPAPAEPPAPPWPPLPTRAEVPGEPVNPPAGPPFGRPMSLGSWQRRGPSAPAADASTPFTGLEQPAQQQQAAQPPQTAPSDGLERGPQGPQTAWPERPGPLAPPSAGPERSGPQTPAGPEQPGPPPPSSARPPAGPPPVEEPPATEAIPVPGTTPPVELFGPFDSEVPVKVDDMDGTPIFAAVASAWFRDPENAGDAPETTALPMNGRPQNWSTAGDAEFEAARLRANRVVDVPTTANGLPQRRPGQQMVPPPQRDTAAGAPRHASSRERQPDRVRSRLASYQRGLREGRHRAAEEHSGPAGNGPAGNGLDGNGSAPWPPGTPMALPDGRGHDADPANGVSPYGRNGRNVS